MRYFPDPITAWVFLSGLTVILGVASYTDERYTQVPKWLTIPALILGLLLSCLRGLLLGANSMPGYFFEANGAALGLVDGLLFALAGSLVGFACLFCVWILGGCGGGDVKLFAALGAWLGPYLVFFSLIVSMVLLSFCFVAVIGMRMMRGKRVELNAGNVSTGSSEGRRKRKAVVIRFSLVALVAVLLVAVWSFRVDLGLASAKPFSSGGVEHVR